MSELTVDKDVLIDIYRKAGKESKETLENLFGKEVFGFDYKKIKTFEDACKHLGISAAFPGLPMGEIRDPNLLSQSVEIYKLTIICKALNNGESIYDESGLAWFPFLTFYTDEALKISRGTPESPVVRACPDTVWTTNGCAYIGYSIGVTFASLPYVDIYFGPHFYVNSREKAKYIGEQFRDILFRCCGITEKNQLDNI